MSRYTSKEVREHCSRTSCWIVVNGEIVDVTEFVGSHPGGSAIILKYAGKDATRAFNEVHALEILRNTLPATSFVGRLIRSAEDQQPVPERTPDQNRMDVERKWMPPLNRILNLDDFEIIARKVMPRRTIGFWTSGADDECTLRENRNAFARLFLIPQILRPVSICDPSTTILGAPSSLPIFISATSLGKLAHPNAETNLTRAAGKLGIIQMASSYSSSTPAELVAARTNPQQCLWFQLYKKADNVEARRVVQEAESLGFKAICLTVDVAAHGNRETDLRTQFQDSLEEKAPSSQMDDEDVDQEGTSGSLLRSDDHDMEWETTIPWLKTVTSLPVIIKGVQSVDDARKAVKAGANGIIVSNHGGRQMEFSLPSIEVLVRIRSEYPKVFDHTEVFVDGGVRRGTDILKALCLGAKAVGVGRPFLYGNGAYGEAGISKILRILEKEFVTGMRLLGVTAIRHLRHDMIDYLSNTCTKL